MNNHHSKTPEFKDFISKNNPMKRDDVRQKRSMMAKEQILAGLHNSQVKVSCVVCKKVVSLPNLSRWHNFCISNN